MNTLKDSVFFAGERESPLFPPPSTLESESTSQKYSGLFPSKASSVYDKREGVSSLYHNVLLNSLFVPLTLLFQGKKNGQRILPTRGKLS